MGLNALEVQLDSQSVVNCIKHGSTGSTLGWGLLQQILHLSKANWVVNFQHVFREANQCVDALANLRCDFAMSRVEFESPPSIVLQLMNNDCRGISFPRLVLV